MMDTTIHPASASACSPEVGPHGGHRSGSCRYCDSDDVETLASQDDWLASAERRGGGPSEVASFVRSDRRLSFGGLVRCRECGFRSVLRVPEPDALAAYYSCYHANTGYGHKELAKVARARRWIGRTATPFGGTRFVDVGCNQGFAVEAARSLGWKAEGIEIDADAVERSRRRFPGLPVACQALSELSRARAESFEFVYCSEVIEHVPDFRAFAKDLARLLVPGGILFLTTPDAGHFRVPRNFIEWWEVKPPEHLNYFSKRHLRELFASLGLAVHLPFRWKTGMHMVARKVRAATGLPTPSKAYGRPTPRSTS